MTADDRKRAVPDEGAAPPRSGVLARWERLRADVAAVIPAGLSVRHFPGGASYSMQWTEGDCRLEVHDKWWRKNSEVWIGYQVHVEGRSDSIVRRAWPVTKKRSEVVAAVREALAMVAS